MSEYSVYIIHITYKICVNQLFILLIRLLVYSRLSGVKLYMIFDCGGLCAPKDQVHREKGSPGTLKEKNNLNWFDDKKKKKGFLEKYLNRDL